MGCTVRPKMKRWYGQYHIFWNVKYVILITLSVPNITFLVINKSPTTIHMKWSLICTWYFTGWVETAPCERKFPKWEQKSHQLVLPRMLTDTPSFPNTFRRHCRPICMLSNHLCARSDSIMDRISAKPTSWVLLWVSMRASTSDMFS